MTYLVYIIVFFCLMLFQTTVLPAFFNAANIYDIMIVFIIYMGFFRSVVESIPVVIILGIVMDCFSGGAFGIYITTYLWLYAVVTVIIQYLHVDSSLLIPFAISIGVIWENCIILMTVAIRNFEISFSAFFAKILAVQILGAVFTGPFVFFIIKNCHSRCEDWFRKISDKYSQSGDF